MSENPEEQQKTIVQKAFKIKPLRQKETIDYPRFEKLSKAIVQIETLQQDKGIGFFMLVPYGEEMLRTFVANSHLITQKMLDDRKEVLLTLSNHKTVINIDLNQIRRKIFIFPENVEDLIIIELLPNEAKDEVFLEASTGFDNEEGGKSNLHEKIAVINDKEKNAIENHLKTTELKSSSELITVSLGKISSVDPNNPFLYAHDLPSDTLKPGLPIFLLNKFCVFGLLKSKLSSPYNLISISHALNKVKNHYETNLKPHEIVVSPDGKRIFQDKGTYIGDFNEQHERHGKGKYIYKDSSVYIGEWENDYRSGKGKMLYSCGDIYEGDWVKGKKEGKGKLTKKSGGYYIGDFLNDLKHGYGERFYDTRVCYKGEYFNGKRSGEGTFYYPNGRMEYKGTYKYGLPNGKGVSYYVTGDMEYIGDWENGFKQGKGKSFYPDGSVYEGDFEEGKRQGQGAKWFIDGRYYFGAFKNDLRNGEGMMNFPDGRRYQGLFKNGYQDGKGILYNERGEKIYEGDWKQGMMWGNGVRYYMGGIKEYEGEFKCGKFDGMGTLYDIKGFVLEKGMWRKGRKIRDKI